MLTEFNIVAQNGQHISNTSKLQSLQPIEVEPIIEYLFSLGLRRQLEQAQCASIWRCCRLFLSLFVFIWMNSTLN